MKKNILVLFLILCSVHSLPGQTTPLPSIEQLQNKIYDAYVQGNMVKWETTLKEMEAMHIRRPSNRLLYDILLAQYGLIGYYIGTGQNAKGAACLDKAEENLKRLSSDREFQTTSLVFESAFLAFRISLRPVRAVQLGPRSYKRIDEAMEKDPTYPRVWIEKGNGAFYTPPVFGGNKADAIGYYQKAIDLLEKKMPNNHRWLYLSTLVALANAYEKTGNLANAIRTTEKALAFEPGFKWAKEEMLPKYRAQQKQ